MKAVAVSPGQPNSVHLREIPTPTLGDGLSAGILLFSGSLYALTLSGQRWLGAITPLGGLAFIAGWALLIWAAYKG